MKSVCCGAEIKDNGICKACKEHAEAVRELPKYQEKLMVVRTEEYWNKKIDTFLQQQKTI